MGKQYYWWTSVISICFIVEGYAEERFVKDALHFYLQSKTSKSINVMVQNLNGGILYSKFIDMLINTSPQYDYVTTLIDLVGLNSAKLDGYSTIMINSKLSSQDKASQVEELITLATIKRHNIISYVQPHEFEALCFANIEALAKSDPLLAKNKTSIENILRGYNDNPEVINTVPSNYPAKQLEKYGYTKGATNFAQYCDIEKIRSKCLHFDQWIIKLLDVIGS